MVVKLFYFFVFFPSCGLVCFSSNDTDTLTSGWSRCDSELRWLNGFTMSDICIFYYLYTRVLINNKMESNDVFALEFPPRPISSLYLTVDPS